MKEASQVHIGSALQVRFAHVIVICQVYQSRLQVLLQCKLHPMSLSTGVLIMPLPSMQVWA